MSNRVLASTTRPVSEVTAVEPAERYRYLWALGSQLEAWRVAWRLVGEGRGVVLRVLVPNTGRRLDVACIDTAAGRQCMWAGGGQHSADDPAGAAEKIVRNLS